MVLAGTRAMLHVLYKNYALDVSCGRVKLFIRRPRQRDSTECRILEAHEVSQCALTCAGSPCEAQQVDRASANDIRLYPS